MKTRLHKLDIFETAGIPGFQSLCPIPEGQDPPTEFLGFRAGLNSTTKGLFLFDEKSAADVISIWNRRGLDLLSDYEHQSLQNPPVIAIASSKKFDLEIRGGDLWVTNIRWTRRAWNYIKEGEYRYFSMAFNTEEAKIEVDGEERDVLRVCRILNFALTNLPSANGIPALVAAKDHLGFDPQELSEAKARFERRSLATFALRAVDYEKYPLVRTAWDADAAIKRARKYAGVESPEDLQDKARQKAYAKFFGYVKNDGKSFDDYILPHHDVNSAGKVVTNVRGVEAAVGAIRGSHGVHPDIPAKDLAAVKRHLEQHLEEWGAQAPWQSTQKNSEKKMAKFSESIKPHVDEVKTDADQMAKALGIDEDEMCKMLDCEPGEMEPEHMKLLKKLADHLEVPVEHLCAYAMGFDPEETEEKASEDVEDKKDDKKDELRALKKSVLSLTGTASISEAKGVLRAMKETHASATDHEKELVALKASLAEIQSREVEREFDALIAAAQRDGKLSPAEVRSTREGSAGQYLSELRDAGDIKGARAYLSALPVKVSPVGSKSLHRETEVQSPIGPEVARVARLVGLREADIEQARARREAAGVETLNSDFFKNATRL